MKFFKSKVPGSQNGDVNVYTKSSTRVKESKYRDVYQQSDMKRSNIQNISSRMYIYIVLGFATIISFLLIQAIFGFCLYLMDFVNHFNNAKIIVQPFMDYFYFVLHKPFYLLSVIGIVIILMGLLYLWLDGEWKTENVRVDNSDINSYADDSMIQEPEALPFEYDIVPDIAMHYDGNVTALYAHMHLNNNGVSVNGDSKVFDKNFSNKLFDSDDIPNDVNLRKLYAPNKLAYNPKGTFGKPNYKTVADFINATWFYPEYETGKPAGIYIVDTSPSNTFVIASTRAGKGQTYIEPIIDLWTRAKEQQNIFINDPKGELYVKFFYPMRKRGMDTVVFNLIDSTHTNIYNPLGYAVDAARHGDFGKMEDFVNDIGSVFFPVEGADDPMWPNAANATFKRSAFGLIDFYMEEEAEMRRVALRNQWTSSKLEQRLDELWGHVTLYNIYQMMTSLASKKSSNKSIISLDSNVELLGESEINQTLEEEGSEEEKDFLTLFFEATAKLPKNPIRISALNNHNTLNTMAGSEKTIASVYGIAMSGLLFFTDDKITRLTSGQLSQNFDMMGLSFPRRFGVRLDKSYVKTHGLNSQICRWSVYEDSKFTKRYAKEGSDFSNHPLLHEGTIQNGWARCAFKGIFPNKVTYLKLELFERESQKRIKTFYFKFVKGREKSLNGRTFVKDPVTSDFVWKNGVLAELVKVNSAHGKILKTGNTTISKSRQSLKNSNKGETVTQKVALFVSKDVHYSERSKGIFMVTPPSKMQYSKLILIMLSQSFNINVDEAYTTKANQKPLYQTKYILDEFGNLQSEGKGIPFLQTKESIGLGQEQQYTLILQTMQQLRDVYGDSIDKILQGNTANIIYLKSNDNDMLNTLITLGGVRHVSRTNSKSTTKSTRSLFSKGNDDSVSLTTSTEEVPVISMNNMLFIPKGNAMTFRLGDYPIWARNQLSLPFAFALHGTGKDVGMYPSNKRYSLLMVPTPSDTDAFDSLGNIPNWTFMVMKRVFQARIATQMYQTYKDVKHLTDDDIQRLDAESVAIDIMSDVSDEVNNILYDKKKTDESNADYENRARSQYEVDIEDVADMSDVASEFMDGVNNAESNLDELQKGVNEYKKADDNIIFIADMSKSEFRNSRNALLSAISKAYDDTKIAFNNPTDRGNGWIVDNDNQLLYNNEVVISDNIGNSSKDEDIDVKYEATSEFMNILTHLDNPEILANSRFMKELEKNIRTMENGMNL